MKTNVEKLSIPEVECNLKQNLDHVKIAGGFIAINEDAVDEDKSDAPVTISEKGEQKHMKIETYMNRRIDEYIVGFKNDIKSKMSTLEIINQPNSSETELEKMREFLEFIFEYPKLVLDKKDFVVSKRRSTPMDTNQENSVSILTNIYPGINTTYGSICGGYSRNYLLY
jgi:uncharacterized protein YnzC (UPF0291/DUF896 family)